MPVITTKKDAYGFIEQTIETEYNAKRVDPIREELKTGVLGKSLYKWCDVQAVLFSSKPSY